MDIFVTVGMGRWPFDRLLQAVRPLCASHNLVVQSGTSNVTLPCCTYRFLPFQDFILQIEKADIVITHAGNTVRLVQRKGKVPIAMARQASKGEMANDHQVDYLRYEEQQGWVVPLWDVANLPRLVETHLATQARILAARPLAQSVPGEVVAAILNRLCEKWIR